MKARLITVAGLLGVLALAPGWGPAPVDASVGCKEVVDEGSVNTVNTAVNCPTVSGGDHNQANASWSTVSGGVSNAATGQGSTIGGGGFNQTLGLDDVIAGGGFNRANGARATVGGGLYNDVE